MQKGIIYIHQPSLSVAHKFQEQFIGSCLGKVQEWFF